MVGPRFNFLNTLLVHNGGAYSIKIFPVRKDTLYVFVIVFVIVAFSVVNVKAHLCQLTT